MGEIIKPCYIIDWRDMSAKRILEELSPILKKNDTIFLLNNGNSEEELTNLKKNIGPLRQIVLIQEVPNRSKPGAAIIRGFKEADFRSYTHAMVWTPEFRVNFDDVEEMWKQAQEHQDYMICAVPSVDPDNVTKRQKIRNFWLSKDIGSRKPYRLNCSTRIYPVQLAYKCMQKHQLGTTIDFDTELFVRLFWAGLHYQMRIAKFNNNVEAPQEPQDFKSLFHEFCNQFNFYGEKLQHKSDIAKGELF